MVREKYMHSIRFGDGTIGSDGRFSGYDTYEDWHLIPTSRPTISMPGVETKFVSIPGRDGSIDLSEYLRNGRPAYGDRSGSFDFYVENDWAEGAKNEEFWMTIYPKIVNILHGKKFKMVLNEDDPDYYWEGRFTVDKYEPGDGYFSGVTISYAVAPFKRRIRKASELMTWDNFNFERDYDSDPLNLSNLTAGWSGDIWCDGYSYPLEVTGLTGSVTVNFNGESETVTAGNTVNVGHAAYGMNHITTTGTSGSTFALDWRGGSL